MSTRDAGPFGDQFVEVVGLGGGQFAHADVVELSGVEPRKWRVFAGGDVADASVRWLAGGDAVLVQEAAQAEELAVGGGDLRLQVGDCGAPRVAFLAELGGEDVHDVVVVRGRSCGLGCGAGGLLGAQLLDPGPQVVVGVEEVEADPGGAGDRPEVDLVAVLDELADRGVGAGDGGLSLGLGGAPEGFGAAFACGGGVLVMTFPVCR